MKQLEKTTDIHPELQRLVKEIAQISFKEGITLNKVRSMIAVERLKIKNSYIIIPDEKEEDSVFRSKVKLFFAEEESSPKGR